MIRGRNEKASNNFHAAQSKSISSSSLLRPTSEERLFPDIKEYKGVCWDVVRFSSSSKSFRRSSVGIPRENLFYLLVDEKPPSSIVQLRSIPFELVTRFHQNFQVIYIYPHKYSTDVASFDFHSFKYEK